VGETARKVSSWPILGCSSTLEAIGSTKRGKDSTYGGRLIRGVVLAAGSKVSALEGTGFSRSMKLAHNGHAGDSRF
jgi:hypothetical protein